MAKHHNELIHNEKRKSGSSKTLLFILDDELIIT